MSETKVKTAKPVKVKKDTKDFSLGYKERLLQVLISPLVNVTEKATKIAEKNNQISFVAMSNAAKSEIKDAVEMIYKVNVTKVHTLWSKPKVKKRGAYEGIKGGYKKAIVSIKKGQEINFATEVAKEKVSE